MCIGTPSGREKTSNMLRLILVLFAAQSALAAPTVDVNFYNIGEGPRIPDNGQLINKYVTDGAFELIDGGDTPLYINILMESINDMANKPDAVSQGVAAMQTITVLGELASGVPGDACQAAAVNNAVASGNSGAIRAAVVNYIQRVSGYIDTIVQLVVNPNAVRFSAGPKGNCYAGGRSYDFEGVWESILNSAGPYQIGLLNEEYCANKRLYDASNARSNNVAAAVTASASGPVNNVAQKAIVPLAQFLRVVAAGGNPTAAGAAAKQALAQAL